jgi:hypothetical protein
MKYGMWSDQASHRGTHFWRCPDGRVIEVTAVVDNLDLYKWPDAVNLGEVTEWVKTGAFPRVRIAPPRS